MSKNRVIMISGVSRGIGLSVAKRLASHGYRLSLGVRDPSSLDGISFDGAQELMIHAYNAVKPDSAQAWVDATAAKMGAIDALVNNAGMTLPFTVLEGEETLLDDMWQVNVKGPLRMVRAAMPHLAQSGRGRVINMASLSGKRVSNMAAGYAMTKFALVALTHAIRIEGWDAGIRATAICPSFVNTDFTANLSGLGIDAHSMTQPEDLATLVATLLQLPNSASVAEILVNSKLEPAW